MFIHTGTDLEYWSGTAFAETVVPFQYHIPFKPVVLRYCWMTCSVSLFPLLKQELPMQIRISFLTSAIFPIVVKDKKKAFGAPNLNSVQIV